MVLEYRADQIHDLRVKIQAQREKIKVLYHVADPCNLPPRNKHRKKFMKRLSFMADQIEKYSTLNCGP